MELIDQASAIRGPAIQLSLGPKRSARRPPRGVARKVSVVMAIVKVHWIAAMLQPCFSWIGWMNRVQPYCRLAIATTQAMPRTSCPQRAMRLALCRLGPLPANPSKLETHAPAHRHRRLLRGRCRPLLPHDLRG